MKLFNLTEFNLNDNQIDFLPKKLYKNIPKIKTFLLSNNNIRDVPLDLCLLFDLVQINFYGNPIRKIRSDVINNSTNLMNYLRKIFDGDEEDKNYEQTRKLNDNDDTNNNKMINNVDESNNNNYFNDNINNRNNNINNNNNYINNYNNFNNNNNYNNNFPPNNYMNQGQNNGMNNFNNNGYNMQNPNNFYH